MRRWICKPGLALALLVVSLPAFAMEWYEAYEEGRKHVEKGNCSAGVPLLQSTLKTHPKDDLRARPYGMITIEYIPHFYLAQCAMKADDLKAAGQYIRAADEGGVAGSKKKKEYAALKQQYDEKRKLAAASQEGTGGTPPRTVDSTVPDPHPGKTGTVEDAAAKQRQLEQQRLAEIRQGVADAQQAFLAGRLQEARQRAQAVLRLDPQNTTARRIIADVETRESANREREAAEIAARNEKQQQLKDVQSLINRGDLASAEAQALRLQQQYPGDAQIGRMLADIRKRMAAATQDEVRSTEKQVVVAFFSGNYEAVIEMVEINETRFRESWRLPYYKGCAYATLAMLDEANRQSRENEARKAFRRAKELSASIPDNPYISPRILDLFRSS